MLVWLPRRSRHLSAISADIVLHFFPRGDRLFSFRVALPGFIGRTATIRQRTCNQGKGQLSTHQDNGIPRRTFAGRSGPNIINLYMPARNRPGGQTSRLVETRTPEPFVYSHLSLTDADRSAEVAPCPDILCDLSRSRANLCHKTFSTHSHTKQKN